MAKNKSTPRSRQEIKNLIFQRQQQIKKIREQIKKSKARQKILRQKIKDALEKRKGIKI